LLVNLSKNEAKTIMQDIVLIGEKARIVLQAGAPIDLRDEQGRADKSMVGHPALVAGTNAPGGRFFPALPRVLRTAGHIRRRGWD
jgi:hypothetical protein